MKKHEMNRRYIEVKRTAHEVCLVNPQDDELMTRALLIDHLQWVTWPICIFILEKFTIREIYVPSFVS